MSRAAQIKKDNMNTAAKFEIKDLAVALAASHVADPLVGRSVAASDEEGFDFLVLERSLEDWGFASSEEDVEALREELRAALGREEERAALGREDES